MVPVLKGARHCGNGDAGPLGENIIVMEASMFSLAFVRSNLVVSLKPCNILLMTFSAIPLTYENM